MTAPKAAHTMAEDYRAERDEMEAECIALRAEVERLRELARHVQAMADDAHLSEHPEWHEICAEARAALGGGK